MIRGTNNYSNTFYFGGGVIKNVAPSTFSFGNVGASKTFYSTNHKPNKDNLSDNYNIEAGANSACNNKASSPSLGKKFILFLTRTAFTMIGVIMVKSLFLCWYNNTYSILELLDNIQSLSSVLVGIGYFTGISIGKLLDFTSFNISIRDLFIHSTFFKTNFKKLLHLFSSLLSTYSKEGSLQDKIDSILLKKKLHLGVDEVPGIKSKIKPQNFDFNLYQESNLGNRKEPSSGNSDLDNVGHNRRSRKDRLASVANAKKFFLPKPWETPQQHEARVKNNDRIRWHRSDKTNPIIDYTEVPRIRDPKVNWKNLDSLKQEFPKLPGETTDHWLGRLGAKERYRAKILKMNPNYNFSPAVPKIIVDDIRHNDPWDPEVETRKQYMDRTYNKARRIYRTGDTNYEKNLPFSPRSGK